MNQTTRRNLLVFCQEEAAKAERKVERELESQHDQTYKELEGTVKALGVVLNREFDKLAKEAGLTVKNGRELQIHSYFFKEEDAFVKAKNASHKEYQKRSRKIQDALSSVKREILLGTDKEAKDVLNSFVETLKGL